MTVHARGYRRHEGGTERPRLRFLPIVAEGYRAGTRGKAFRRLGLLFVVIVVFHGVMLYLDPAALFPRRMRGGLGQVTSDDLMRRVLAFFARSLAGLVPLVAMFVGAGSVADDLRSRALPLYLVRPVTPTDYWLGKVLAPAAVTATAYGVPFVALVAFGVLIRPSEEILPFAWRHLPSLGAVVLHVGVTALAYASVVVTLSTLVGRRIGTMVAFAGVVYGGEMLRLFSQTAPPDLAEPLRALSLGTDARVLLHELLDVTLEHSGPQPAVTSAVAVLAACVLLGALVVVRRARSVEVTS